MFEEVDEIEIRAAQPGDADAVAHYHRRCFINTYSAQLLAGELEPPDLAGMRRQFRGWFQSESGFETRVAVAKGTPIGHVTVSGCQLVHLFVEPDHQGRGLGRQLLSLGEEIIGASGHTRFELHARVENFAAIAFYEAAGWTVTNRLIGTVEHGASYDEHVLVKNDTS